MIFMTANRRLRLSGGIWIATTSFSWPPRRVGKTSLIKRLVVEAPTEGLLAGFIGLDTVTGRYNLGDTINEPQMMGLGPFAERLSENSSKSNRIKNRPGTIWVLGE